jgi:hypothetical protein
MPVTSSTLSDKGMAPQFTVERDRPRRLMVDQSVAPAEACLSIASQPSLYSPVCRTPCPPLWLQMSRSVDPGVLCNETVYGQTRAIEGTDCDRGLCVAGAQGRRRSEPGPFARRLVPNPGGPLPSYLAGECLTILWKGTRNDYGCSGTRRSMRTSPKLATCGRSLGVRVDPC